MQGGNAIADVLFGDVNPSGKLPASFPRAVGQEPLYYNHMNTGRPPDEKQKYTSKYLDEPWTPLFPFGFGLSYTKFRISNLQLSATQIKPDGTVQASVDIENVGQREGTGGEGWTIVDDITDAGAKSILPGEDAGAGRRADRVRARTTEHDAVADE